MTPTEKALELVEKYFDTCHKSSDLELSWKVCKQCALIAVDEILGQFRWRPSDGLSYWEEVKQEIDNL
jgi:hypothetical protein